MEIGGWVALAVLWALVNLMTKGKKRTATQQEGSRLELVRRQFERALEEAAPEIEGRRLRAADPEVINLETEVRREVRRQVDQDEGAEDIEARRISAASARDKATTKVDHAAFDKRIRQEAADKTATRYTTRQLRDAMVWREILDEPVSLRDSEK
jgi:hypothetical protein